MNRASVVHFAHDSCAPWRSFGSFRANLASILGYGDRGPELYQRKGALPCRILLAEPETAQIAGRGEDDVEAGMEDLKSEDLE